jgi:hypothetical protein
MQPAEKLTKLLVSNAETRRFAKNAFRKPNVHCVYCGDWYQCRDHYVARDWLGYNRTYTAGDVVPSCSQCNTLLSNIPLFEIGERAEYLMEAVERKNQKWLMVPRWSELELVELGYNLRKQIRMALMLRAITIARLKNSDLVALGYEPVPIQIVHYGTQEVQAA